MKKLILLLSIPLALTSCDSPQRSRIPTSLVNGNNITETTNKASGLEDVPTGTTSGSTSGTTNGTSGTLGPGFETCDLADKYQTVDIGLFGICQSKSDETLFKLRTSLSSTNVRVCLIPTYKEPSGSSTYIGQPQCTYTTSNQVISGKLLKDRQGFSSYSLNGVIILKEPLLAEYFSCMQAYISWPGNVCNGKSSSYCSYWAPRCPYGGRSNALCDTEAKNYMASICNSFKSKYTNSYLDLKTKD